MLGHFRELVGDVIGMTPRRRSLPWLIHDGEKKFSPRRIHRLWKRSPALEPLTCEVAGCTAGTMMGGKAQQKRRKVMRIAIDIEEA